MLKVLIADKLPDNARMRLQEAGMAVHALPGLSDQALAEALAEHDPDVLVVRSTQVRAGHVAAAPGLQLIVRAGAGVNTIDLAAASARGVYVSNCPGMNAVAVAELTWGHILNADRRIADGVAALRSGTWSKKAFSKLGRGLKGRTMAVLGTGSVGREVIARAHAFELDVVAWSPSLTLEGAARLGVRRAESIVEAARDADIVTVHVALNPATRSLIGRAVFEAMHAGGVFVNTTRGPVVDEEALAWAVRERGLLAGLDVFCDEPSADGAWVHPLAGLPGVYGTHHIGASTVQAQDAVAEEACRVILEWASGGGAPHCVNLARKTAATHLLVVRHRDQVGVLARVLDAISDDGMNVQHMDNIIFSGGGAACARIQVARAPSARLLSRLESMDPVFDAKLVALED